MGTQPNIGSQGRGSYFEVGGGGQTSPGVQGSPYPKLKTPRIWPTIFLGETEVRVQKQTKIKVNDINSPKLGQRPLSFQVVGASCPHCPPPPVPASLLGTPKISFSSDFRHFILKML